MKNKKISFEVSPRLYNHIRAIAKVSSINEARNVSISEVCRRVLISCLNYENATVEFVERDPLQSEMLKSLPTNSI